MSLSRTVGRPFTRADQFWKPVTSTWSRMDSAKNWQQGGAMSNHKCMICSQRPARDDGFCVNCARSMEAERRRKRPPTPAYYLAYRSMVVALMPNGNGGYKPVASERNPDHLPKGKTVNLDVWCPGYTREQVKRFKKAVLTLHHA